MRGKTSSLVMLVALLMAAPASAGFLAEQVDEGIYFVSYQRGQMLRGNVLFDTEKKVQRRLEKKAHQFCLENGYSYLRFPTLGEIARDDYLRTVWELGSGDESQNSSDPEGTQYGLNHTHKSRKLLLLSSEPLEGFATCRLPE